MQHYDETRVLIAPASQAELKRIAAKVKAQDEERERNARGWARLCGMVAPIGPARY